MSRGLAGLMREQAARERASFRQAFRAIAARNNHKGAQIGVQMQGLAGENVSGELMQHYGFTSAPLAGAEYIVLPVGGTSRHSVVIASEDGRYRVKLADGEVALYTDEGDYIHLKRGRLIEVETQTLVVKASTKVVFETPKIEAAGHIAAAGEVSDGIRAMSEDRAIYNGHKHGSSPVPDAQQ
ncbi:Phage baseplate assembly protein V [Pseudomonas sp. 8Z]|uniref:phage baseplate assembly protein domain-containing protein n=1 Tax=Pseudomonas sp. 8Z TaxID=2653166 RepID=UPI0012F35850|nr:phage baseplate assembly protein [Pseudomonas sp. 8Z]VXC71743.1 Phage baseplate assembly protein V [Pseudomonas sp. 8Z]